MQAAVQRMRATPTPAGGLLQGVNGIDMPMPIPQTNDRVGFVFVISLGAWPLATNPLWIRHW